ncbi:septum site-determining protein Ssd [Streptomyces sp. NPDC050560]|uniref:septum site-determining protein Ssd n=1 Tax=Streptomyces sp. NPDC050560 TaxID=3365630 RepID=UPI0037892FB6
MATQETADRSAPPAGRQRTGPLIVTEDIELLDDLLRLCAVAGARPEVNHGLPRHRGSWETAPLILVGEDAAPRLAGATRRRGVVLIGRSEADTALWRHGVRLGADQVLSLPEGEKWLVDRIADVADGADEPAFTVGVLGGRGGAGASTLACALAVTSARREVRTMLIDADPLGGGLDVMLGGERAQGLRWPALAASRGRLAAGALEESLPRLHSLRLLSWDRGDSVAVPPEAVRAVVAAARRRGGAVVLDLPRRVDDGTGEALAQTDLGLLVVPAELRAVAAATRVAAATGTSLRDLRVVVAPPPGHRSAALEAREVADLVGLPLAGELPHEPGLLTDQESGAPPGGDARSPLARFCTALWERLPVPEAAA